MEWTVVLEVAVVEIVSAGLVIATIGIVMTEVTEVMVVTQHMSPKQNCNFHQLGPTGPSWS